MADSLVEVVHARAAHKHALAVGSAGPSVDVVGDARPDGHAAVRDGESGPPPPGAHTIVVRAVDNHGTDVTLTYHLTID
jgi:hypothetical protein